MSSTSSPADSPAPPERSPTAAAQVSPAPRPVLPYATPKPRSPLLSAEAWSPLKVELFRSLYIATSIAQIGIWAREAASPWLMETLTRGWHNQPDMVSKVITYSNLPICLFSVIAGALADVLDRRRLLIWTNVWMVVVSSLLGLLTWAGFISPLSLLGMTFLLGVGTTAMGPALQGLLPELVPPKEMALAINLNSVALNFARAAGPASFILVIAVFGSNERHGVAASYLLSALTFAGAVWVLWRWKRAPQKAALHGEEMWGAIRFGFRYTVWSPANRAILLRVFAFIVPALVLWAQVPTIATRQLHIGGDAPAATVDAKAHQAAPMTPAAAAAAETARLRHRMVVARGYAMLFSFIGVGAIVGVLLMPGLHARYSIDPVVNVCTFLFAMGLIALAYVHHLWLAAFVMVFLGVNWVIIPTNFNTATQKSVPLWVKGRAISFYLTVLFGSFAIGGALWGKVTTATSIHTSLLAGGISMAALLVLAFWFPLTINEGLDLSPAFKAPPGAAGSPPAGHALAAFAPAPGPGGGPVGPSDTTPGPAANEAALLAASAAPGPTAVTIDYQVEPGREGEFLALMREVGQQRRRNGATGWRLDRAGGRGPAPAGPVPYRETFHFLTATEHARQASRMTKADIALLDRVLACTAEPPAVRHAPSELQPLNHRMRQQAAETLLNSAFRTLEEAEVVVERMKARRNRDPFAYARDYREEGQLGSDRPA